MANNSRLRKALRKVSKPQSGWLDVFPAVIGKEDGTVLTGVAGEIFVRNVLNGQTLTVHNTVAPAIATLQVEVGRRVEQPGLWQIKGVRESFSTPAGGSKVAYHKEQHIFPAPDAPILPRKQIRELTVLVTDGPNFIVQVFGGDVRGSTAYFLVDSQTVDLSSYVPATGAIYVNIETDESGVLSVNAGADFLTPALGTAADIPVPATGKRRIATILLFETMTELLDSHILVPMVLEGEAGGGAVDSVNGQTGVVVLDAADVGAAPSYLLNMYGSASVWATSTAYIVGSNVYWTNGTVQFYLLCKTAHTSGTLITDDWEKWELVFAITQSVSDTAYDATSWNAVTTYAPSKNAVRDQIETMLTSIAAKVVANTAITGATKTKITYDAKGLVTAGADATTADIADSTNKRYVTDAQLTVIGNTSGTNSGDETATRIGALIGGAADATPNDTDFVATSLTAGGILKKITWTNVKAFLKTYWDTLYAPIAKGVTNGDAHTHSQHLDRTRNIPFPALTDTAAVIGSGDVHGSLSQDYHFHLANAVGTIIKNLAGIPVPQDVVSGGTCNFVWLWSSDAAGNNCNYTVVCREVGSNDTAHTSLVANTADYAANANANKVQRSSIAMTAPTPGKSISFALIRNGAAAGDTNTGTVSLWGVFCEYTADM